MEREKVITIGPRYAVRLDDLAADHRLSVKCRACGHSAGMDPATLRCRFPAYTRLIVIEKKLRCQACGNDEGNVLKVERIGA
jgi:hypothetical protein